MSFFSCSFSVCVWIFLSALKVGSSLQCYHCNITEFNPHVYDPCLGIQTWLKCQEPAVCITATYSHGYPYSRGTMKVLKSCYPPMAGEECTNFMRNVKNVDGISRNVVFRHFCQTCDTDGCNFEPAGLLLRVETPYMVGTSAVATISLLCFVPFSIRMLV